MEEVYGLEWRLAGEDVSHIHLGYWDDDTPLLDIKAAHRNYMREVFRELPLKPSDTVLDIGAGTGATAIWLAETFGCRVHAVDVVALHVEAMRRAVAARGLEDRVTPVCADIAELDFPDGAFDHAYSLECLYHVADRGAVFRRLATWLKPGGRIALAENTLAPGCPVLYRRAVELITASTVMAPIGDYETRLAEADFAVVGKRDVTRFTLLKVREWERADPDSTLKDYTRRLYGPFLALLAPAVFWLAERSVRSGRWALYFLTAERRRD